jgi:hypothetical protein
MHRFEIDAGGGKDEMKYLPVSFIAREAAPVSLVGRLSNSNPDCQRSFLQ